MPRVNFDSFSVEAGEGWQDVTQELNMDNAPLTLAKTTGAGMLQFSVNVKKGIESSLQADPEVMLNHIYNWAKERSLGEGLNPLTTKSPLPFAAASFHSGSEFIRIWLLSDNTNTALITYLSAWEDREAEISECEAMVHSFQFDSGAD